ncbi:MAG TPA: glutamate--cysteine ligase, partial [Deltaproteobacteria bacterium]|nr:glutamate--cysteine ligase [Deltaproteobacteria bacterium]
GGEFERAVVRRNGAPVRYDDPNGIRWILEQVRDGQPDWDGIYEDTNLIALVRPNAANVTLEPGGQVELSGAPHRTLSEVAAELDENRSFLLQLAEGRDLQWTACGLTPIAPISSIGWMPKGRYAIMREYLPTQGDLALWMMKGTCSVQANYDYADETDCARKVRLCAGLAPLTTALFANSPLSENKPTGFLSTRGHVWTRTDPDRTGFPPGLRSDYGHERWVDYLLDVPMMFYRRGSEWLPARGTSFREYMTQGIEGHFPNWKDWDLHQTSVFPEVRIKRTIEVRGADCVSADLSMAFCALFTGLLYCPSALEAGLALVDDIERHGTRDQRLDVACRDGLGGTIDGGSLGEWARELGTIAAEGLSRCMPNDRVMLDPLLARIESGRSPALDILEAWERDPSPEAVIRSVAY